MPELLELHQAADQIIRGAVNWSDESMPSNEEVLVRCPLFNHYRQQGYEIGIDSEYGVVITEWDPRIEEDGTYHDLVWNGFTLFNWLMKLAEVTGSDNSPEICDQLAELITDKVYALGVEANG